MGETRYISHRGEHSTVPENTLKAFQLAWVRGADGVECDIRFTKDGAIVVYHDGTLKRLLPDGDSRKVADCTLKELQELDLTPLVPKENRNGKTFDDKIPTLADILTIVPEGKVMYIELKSGGQKFCEAVAKEVRKSKPPVDRIRFLCSNPSKTKTMRALLPEYNAYISMDLWDKKNNHLQDVDTLIKIAKDANATGIDLGFRIEYWNESVVQKIHDAELDLNCWVVDTVKSARVAKELGVDSMTTNRAPLLKRELEGSADNP